MKLKVGDRVRGYRYPEGDIVGTIETIFENGAIDILPDVGSSRRAFHPKQCRRLVKKERRRVWLSPGAVKKSWSYSDHESKIGITQYPMVAKEHPDWIEFVEVKKK